MNKKRVTLDELINKASQKDSKEKYIELYVKSIDGTIKLKKPDNDLILDALDIAKDNSHDGDLHLVYNSIIEPNVKDTRLHSAYEVSRPCEVLDKIFTLGEIMSISKELVKDSGFFDEDNTTLIDNLKN